MRSNAVKEVQKALGLRQDGVFGVKTHMAVTLFQEAHGMVADGIVGPRTWKALTGRELNAESLVKQLQNPYKNMEYAAKYLVYLREVLHTDDPDILAAAYNGGEASKAVAYMLKVRRANE